MRISPHRNSSGISIKLTDFRTDPDSPRVVKMLEDDYVMTDLPYLDEIGDLALFTRHSGANVRSGL